MRIKIKLFSLILLSILSSGLLAPEAAAQSNTQAIATQQPVAQQPTVKPSAQQRGTFSGVVVDSAGEPVIGAAIMPTRQAQPQSQAQSQAQPQAQSQPDFMGGGTSSITDIDGNFTVTAAEGETFLISCLGYVDQEIKATLSTPVKIILKEDFESLADAVVVGYGVQKKANLSGSVSAVNFSEAGENRALTSISEGLQGLSAGLLAVQNSGEPGNDGAAITIRGVGTMNNSSPLVVIDGIVGSLADVNPADVESMSVLKDAASSAIYGSRAANGVILVTTKSGSKEKVRVTYNFHGGVQTVTMPIKTVSSYPLYMQTINRAFANAGQTQPFSREIIEEWMAGSKTDPIVYANTNWFNEVFRPSAIYDHNLQVSGGSEKVKYLISLGYLDNEGTLRKTDYKKVTLRANLSAEINSWLTVHLNLSGYHGIQQGVELSSVMTALGNSSPGTYPVHPDGRFGGEWAPGGNVQAGNVFAALSSYDKSTNNTHLNGKLGIDIKFTPNLVWKSSVAVTGAFGFLHQMNYPDVKIWDFKNNAVLMTSGTTSVQLTENHTRAYSYIIDSYLQWNILPKITDHNLNATLGYNQEYSQSRSTEALGLDVLSNDTDVMNAATTPSKLAGTFTNWAVMSFFGRINYDYKGKYIFEANIRGDGSSRFALKNRWGFFPSFSAAYRISEESWMKNQRVFDNLKLRLSWGQLGNNAVGDYATQLLYKRKQYVFGESAVEGAAITALVDENLKWETTSMTNIGLDMGFFKNKLAVTVDAFEKITDDILVRTKIPGVFGSLTAPIQNVGKVRNRGIETEITWKHTVGDFSYNISANYSFVKNKVLKYQGDVAAYTGQRILLEGYGMYDFYVREVDCIATQEKIEEMLADGYQFFPSTPHPGDFIYKDQQQPGEKGYKVIDDNDRVIKGHSYPTSFFGLNFSLAWKGIDFSMMFSGVAGGSAYLNGTMYTNVLKNGSLINEKFLNCWSPSNPDSKIPAITSDDGGRNTVSNDYWLQDASYLKLRNVSLGYTLPQNITKKFFVQRLRLYATGENLLTLTKFEGVDPETGAVTNYPTMRRFTLGVSITF